MKKEADDSDFDFYARIVALGAVSGLRSLTAPALLSYFASGKTAGELKNNFTASPKIAVALGALAVGELIGDKLPFTPNRTEPAGLAARIVSGAFVGGSLSSARKKSVLSGVVIGALSSIAAAYAGQTIRRAISEETGVPSAICGAVEDAIAIGIGYNALKDFK